ncbi:MAG TPA: VOC family protein [Tahibacter sp.]|uniref:VOC family protein n=1 Tax=Tahibacter sp. TaxID=2056211 RepID=UPI002C1EA863|nr:VOC family protein [Tahibacter sp.]HSX62644.1 VOC family protein [Tahibacter sp.]
MTPPFRIREIDHLVLRARDQEALVRFYCDVVGCRIEKRQDAIGLVQLRAGRSLIDIVGVDGKLGRAGGAAPGMQGRNLDHLCLRIEPFDLDALRAHLAAHGVKPGDYGSRYGAEGEGPSLYFDDIEGNTVEFKGAPGPA